MAEFLCRIFVSNPLCEDEEIILESTDIHYLKNVLRATTGQTLRLFNEKDGEWSGQILDLSKNKCILKLITRLKQQTPPPPLNLYFSPIRQNRMDILIEKATELGVFEFYPILTDFTQVRKINIERLQLQIKEASEQSEQLHVAKIHEPVKLDSILKSQKSLWICDERRMGQHILSMKPTGAIHVVIGPEGGFSDREKTLMEHNTKVSLGNSILRAETAAICAVGFSNYLLQSKL